MSSGQSRSVALTELTIIRTAPPFHPAGQKPRASCPFCVRDKGDHTVRDLYSIRGFHEDEHDPAIPPIWFTAPPMSLDGRTREMEALRVGQQSLQQSSS